MLKPLNPQQRASQAYGGSGAGGGVLRGSHRILLHAHQALAERVELLRELDLRGAAARQQRLAVAVPAMDMDMAA